MSADEAGLKWAGQYRQDGRPVAFVAGVPARDLTPAEVAALPKGQADALVKSGLYSKPDAKKPASKKAGE